MNTLSALKRRNFRHYYFSSVAGVNGMWIFRVLMSWSAWEISGSASFVGLIAALSLLPVALAGPLFGTLVDQASIRRSFVAVSLSLLACPLIFVVLLASGLLGQVSLALLAMVFGLAVSAYHPVRQSIGPRLVEREEVGAVVSLSALNFNVGRMISPVIGGFLIAGAGELVAGILSTVLFLPNLAIIAGLHPRDLPPRTRGPFLTELAEGAREAWRRPEARLAMIVGAFGLGPIRALAETLPLLADGIFGQGAKGLGLLTSAIGGGALVAALLQVSLGHRLASWRALPWVVLMIGQTGTAIMVWAPSFSIAIAASTMAGFTSAFLAVWLQTTIQQDLPDALRGRVMSMWMVSVTLSTSAFAYVVSLGTDAIGLPLAMALLQVGGLSALVLSLVLGQTGGRSGRY